MKTEAIRSTDEEDEEDQIPEGFHLQVESPHCLNMQRAEDFQAYLRQLVLEFKKMLKVGGTDMKAEYGKVIESFFWACKATKQTICNDAVPEDVLASVEDLSCKAWKWKLNGKDSADPTTLVPEPVVAQQRANADAADHLVPLTKIASLPVVMTVINTCQRQVVAVKIPEVDEMMQRSTR